MIKLGTGMLALGEHRISKRGIPYVNGAVQWISRLLLTTLWIVAVTGGPTAAWGQATDIEAGVSAIQNEAYAEAIEHLAPVVQADPAVVYNDQPVGYWLGVAYRETGSVQQALATWQQTLNQLDRDDPHRLSSMDQLIRTTFAYDQATYHQLASYAYLDLISWIEGVDTLEKAHQNLVRQHAWEVAIILPDSIQARTGINPDELQQQNASMQPSEHAAEILQGWWRREDRLPATPHNERLLEHLGRVAYAHQYFKSGDVVDDRGKILIRLGLPSGSKEVDFHDAQFRRDVIQENRRLNTFDFAENEFWWYHNLGDEVNFLFVKDNAGVYRIGEVTDLFPRSLQRGQYAGGSRNQEQAYAFLRSMEVALRQLSLQNPTYMGRYTEVGNVVAALGAGGLMHGEPGMGHYAGNIHERSAREDRRLNRKREEIVGAHQSDLGESRPSLPIAKRWARFLNEDGTTRTDVYWTVSTSDIPPGEFHHDRWEDRDTDNLPTRHRLVTNLNLEHEDHRSSERARAAHVVSESDAHDQLAPQTITVETDEPIFHLALQWDQLMGERPADAGNYVMRRTVERIDTLQALDGSGNTLEVSDLKLFTAGSGQDVHTLRRDELTPYPMQHAQQDTPLGLYFEVYHLMFDADDRTRYTVDLEVDRLQTRGRIARWLRGEERQQTSTTSTYEGDARRTEEMLLLDMEAWEGLDRDEEVTVTVRVTDEVSGATTERTLQFALQDTAPTMAMD